MVHKQLVYVMALRSTGKFSVTDNGGREKDSMRERERERERTSETETG